MQKCGSVVRAHALRSGFCILKFAISLLLTGVFCAVLGGNALLAGALLQRSDDLDVVQVRPDFYMIAGAGGNVAAQIGPAGVVLVDTGSAQMADAVLAAIKRLTDRPIRYVINTSADADHVGRQRQAIEGGADHPGSSRKQRRERGGLYQRRRGRRTRARERPHQHERARVSVSLCGAADKDLYRPQLSHVSQRRRHPGHDTCPPPTPTATASSSSGAPT